MAERPHNTVTRSFCFIPLLMAFDDPVRPQDQKKKVVLFRPLGAAEEIQKYVTGAFVSNDVNLTTGLELSLSFVPAFVPGLESGLVWPIIKLYSSGVTAACTLSCHCLSRLPCTPIHPSRFILFVSQLLRPSFLSSPSPPSFLPTSRYSPESARIITRTAHH
jgi:hypothetical protein